MKGLPEDTGLKGFVCLMAMVLANQTCGRAIFVANLARKHVRFTGSLGRLFGVLECLMVTPFDRT